MRAVLFTIALVTFVPAAAAQPPSPFWFDQMALETGTPDIGAGPAEDFDAPVDVTSCRWSAAECAEFDLTDPEDARDIRIFNYLEDLDAKIAKADLLMFGQPRSVLTQEQLAAVEDGGADGE